MAEDLQAENNRFHRLFRQFSSESKAVSIATVALVVAALSLLMAWMAVYDAIHAKIQVETELEATRAELTESKNRTTLYITYVQTLHSDLVIKGFEPPPLPEE